MDFSGQLRSQEREASWSSLTISINIIFTDFSFILLIPYILLGASVLVGASICDSFPHTLLFKAAVMQIYR